MTGRALLGFGMDELGDDPRAVFETLACMLKTQEDRARITREVAVTAGGLNLGCRRLIETNPAEVVRVAMASDACVFDCDTQDDYAAMLARSAPVAEPVLRP